MLRKTMMAFAASAVLALAVVPTGASARVGGFGHGGVGHVSVGHVGAGHVGGWGRAGFARPGFGRFGGVHRFGRFGFHRFHRFGVRRGPAFVGVYPTCWRWVSGPFGWHLAWVCGPHRYW
jgi:hypothetical protein